MICGECKYNTYEKDFCCGNEESENYGLLIAYGDSCEDGEEKDND